MRPGFKQLYQSCPKCQRQLQPKDEGLHCQHCQLDFYDNPAPVVTIMVLRDHQLLLTKRGIDPFKGSWDSPGGFINPGETAEEAAIREMKEETNLDIKIVDYLASSHDTYGGSDPTLSYNFEAEITGGEMHAQDDVAELKWWPIDQLPDNIAFKNTREAIAQVKKKYKLT